MEWWLLADLLFLVVLCAIYIPLGGYCIFTLHKHHERSFYQKREHPMLTGVSLIFSLISNVFGALVPFVTEDEETLLGILVHTVSTIFWNGSIVLVFYTIGSQAWFVFYKSNLDKVLTEHKWSSMVDTSILTQNKFEANWFVVHKKTVGKSTFVKHYYGIYCLLWFLVGTLCSILVIWSGFEASISVVCSLINAVILMPAPCVYIYIVSHTARFNDVYHIFHQARMHARLLLIKTIAIACAATPAIVFGHFEDAHTVIWLWIVPTSVDMCIIYYSTIWIIRQNSQSVDMRSRSPSVGASRVGSRSVSASPIQIFSGHTVTSALQSKPALSFAEAAVSSREASPEPSDVGSDDHVVKSKKKWTLKDVLADGVMFDLFVQHLDKEFACENMAFLVESQQFASELLLFSQSNGLSSVDEMLKCGASRFVELPNGIVPVSTIVSNPSISFHEKAVLIYKKYIEVGSEYTVNISYKDRNQLTNSIERNVDFSKEPEIVLFNLFSPCEYEVLRMFLPSFIRFQSTDEYIQALDERKEQ